MLLAIHVGPAEPARDHASDVAARFEQRDGTSFAGRCDGGDGAASCRAVDDHVVLFFSSTVLRIRRREGERGRDEEPGDLTHAAHYRANLCARNTGNGHPLQVSANRRYSNGLTVYGPLWSIHAAWLDFDRDGWLDLFVVNYCVWDPATEPFCGPAPGLRTYCHPDRYAPLPNQLFRNNGDGTFTEVSDQSGIVRQLGKGMVPRSPMSMATGGPISSPANDTVPNFLFRNRGDGTFEEVAAAWGVAVNQFGTAVSAMGADLRDVDKDGRVDLFVTDLTNEGFLLFRHAGGWYEDASDVARVTLATLPYTAGAIRSPTTTTAGRI
jgi:hypothetical protein